MATFTKTALGSRQSSECFGQMTICGRLADIHAEISETPTMNGCFSQEQTVAKISGMTEMRTKQPFPAGHRSEAFYTSALNCVGHQLGALFMVNGSCPPTARSSYSRVQNEETR